MPNPDFLHRRYQDLNASPEVKQAARRTTRRTKRELPQRSHEDRIANYLQRLADFRAHVDSVKRPKAKEHGIEHAKDLILDRFITKYEDIPDSYWKSYETNLRAHGQQADWQSMSADQQEQMKRQDTAPLLEDQRASLEEWLDYFLLHDSDDIPDALKYWAFRSLTQLQAFEKEEGSTHIEFNRRSKGSLKKFPDLNHEALRTVTDAIMKKYRGEAVTFEYDIQPEEAATFQRYLQTEKFADLYAWATELMNPIPEHLLPEIRGEWRKYPKGSDSELLAQTLRGKGTGLGIAGKGAAKRYLENGDLYVYYSFDENEQPIFPRAAIHVTSDNKVAEVRGVAYKQNLDPCITPVVEAKLAEFPDGMKYQKKSADMKQLTAIEQKIKTHTSLNQHDLTFLYEVDSAIQGFGYHKDPRIAELRKGRDTHADMLVIFDCTADQIAHNRSQVNERTKAYVGQLYPSIFTQLAHLEHIYTAFPEKKIRRTTVEIGGKTKEQLQAELDQKNIYVTAWAKDIMKKITTTTEPTNVDMINLTVADLGFTSYCTTTELFARAKALGLELCPAEVGPHYRLQYTDQPEDEYRSIGMEPIADSDGYPSVFCLHHDGDLLKLYAYSANPDFQWDPAREFAFSPRKVERLAA